MSRESGTWPWFSLHVSIVERGDPIQLESEKGKEKKHNQQKELFYTRVLICSQQTTRDWSNKLVERSGDKVLPRRKVEEVAGSRWDGLYDEEKEVQIFRGYPPRGADRSAFRQCCAFRQIKTFGRIVCGPCLKVS